jgi:hypothetical protein
MCDNEMFSSTKKSWKQAVNQWKSENNMSLLNEPDLVKLLKKINDDHIKTEAIKDSFRAAGIYPFNVENVVFERCLDSLTPTALEDATEDPAIKVDTEESSVPEVDPAISPAPEATSAQDVINILNSILEQLKNFVLPYMSENHIECAELAAAAEKQVSFLRNFVASNSLTPKISQGFTSAASFNGPHQKFNCNLPKSDELKKKQDDETKLTLNNAKGEKSEPQKKQQRHEEEKKLQKKRQHSECDDDDSEPCSKYKRN